MNIGFSGIGHVVIDNVGNAADVDPACSDISGNKDGISPIFKAFQSLCPVVLGHVSLQRGSFQSFFRELDREFFRFVLRSGKDQGCPHGFCFDQVHK